MIYEKNKLHITKSFEPLLQHLVVIPGGKIFCLIRNLHGNFQLNKKTVANESL